MPAASDRRPRTGAPLVALPTDAPVWDRFFLAAPLVIVGTKGADGFDLAPKHMAMPIGWSNRYGFVCTPRHTTYRNLLVHPEFTVSFPGPDRLLHTSLAAGERDEAGEKPSLAAVPTVPATHIDGVLVEGCPLHLECTVERIVDGFGDNSLIVGKVVAALAREDVLRGEDVDDADLLHLSPLLVYASPGRLGVLRDTTAFPFPVGFGR